MAIFNERDGLTILSNATDPEFDPLYVSRVNGDGGLIGTPIALSVGGSVTIMADGTTTFDDTGMTWPDPGNSVGDSVIAEVTDGINFVDVSVNLLIHVAA